MELASFVQTYAQMDKLMATQRDIWHKAQGDLKELQIQLNMLSLGHLSPSTISPNEFWQLLKVKPTHLPFFLKLPSDPEKDLWDFYNIWTCRAVLDGNHIYVVVSVPLLDENSKYEVYKVHNLPVPINSTSEVKNSGMIARYSLESNYFAVNGDNSKFILLSNSELPHCVNPWQKFCKIESPIYPINLSKLCIVALFMDHKDNVNKFCQAIISPSSTLPLANYLFNGMWAIVTVKQLQFTIVCQASNLRDSIITVNPPLGLVQLPVSCTASNNYLFLPAFYHNESKYEISDLFKDDTSLFNISNINLGKPLTSKIPNCNGTWLPKRLKPLDEISIDNLFNELDPLDMVIFEETGTIPVWVWVLISFGSLVLLLALVFGLRRSERDKQFMLARKKSSTMSSVTYARRRVLPTDAGSDEGLEGGATEKTSAPLMTADFNEEELKKMYPKLDLITVKA